LARIEQRHRQDRQTDRSDKGSVALDEPFYRRSPKSPIKARQTDTYPDIEISKPALVYNSLVMTSVWW